MVRDSTNFKMYAALYERVEMAEIRTHGNNLWFLLAINHFGQGSDSFLERTKREVHQQLTNNADNRFGLV